MVLVELPAATKEKSGSEKMKSTIPSVRRKRLHWKALDASKIRNTLWEEQDEDDDIHVDEEEFKKLFVEKIGTDKGNTPGVTEVGNQTKKTRRRTMVNLIDLKRGQNAGIALVSLKISFAEVSATSFSSRILFPVSS